MPSRPFDQPTPKDDTHHLAMGRSAAGLPSVICFRIFVYGTFFYIYITMVFVHCKTYLYNIG